MNEGDVDDAVRVLRHKPIYGPAAVYLQDFKDLINSISDGWCYWSYGTKCAQSLQAIVQEGIHLERPWGAYADTIATATAADVVKAAAKIKRFLNTCKQTKGRNLPIPVLQPSTPMSLDLTFD